MGHNELMTTEKDSNFMPQILKKYSGGPSENVVGFDCIQTDHREYFLIHYLSFSLLVLYSSFSSDLTYSHISQKISRISFREFVDPISVLQSPISVVQLTCFSQDARY